MVIGLFVTVVFLCLLFYFITYPYKCRFKRKLKRVLSYEEVRYTKGIRLDLNRISKEEVYDNFNIEIKTINSVHVEEPMRFIVVTPKKNIDLKTVPCLILLHGIRDCSEDWLERGKLLENYLILNRNKDIGDIIFILPDSGYDGESWYTNFYKDNKYKYEDYMMDELYKEIRKITPEGKLGIAGFSMGGYAAYKIGLKHLKRFQVVGSFSGAVSLIRMSVNRRVMRIMKYVYIPKFLFNDLDKSNFIKIFSPWGWRILKQDPYSIIKIMDEKEFVDKKFYLSVGSEDKKPYLMFQQWIDIVGRLKRYNVNFKAYIYRNEYHTWEFISKDLSCFLKYFNKSINNID
ncbi:alpha/beta hydrolase [Fusobacterium sp. MFO224]|uniref:alpha/beta hydrolase n=1 Tax=Fusobacterium sp. MFO224 TaxID=3378070 RepID=UPI0038528A95